MRAWRTVCAGELYAAHFLGESAARHLITLQSAVCGGARGPRGPAGGKSEPQGFYHADSSAKTIGEVYAWAVGDRATHPAFVQQQRMSATTDASRASRDTAAAITTVRSARYDAADSIGMGMRSARFVLAGHGAPATATLRYSPLSLSSGVLEILSALAVPSRTMQEG